MKNFIHFYALIGAYISASLIFPALIAFGSDEIEIGYRLLLYGSTGGFLFFAVLLSIRDEEHHLERSTAILLAVASWVSFPFLIAFPLMDVAGLSLVHSIFQGFSVFTTSGALIFANFQELPKSVLFYLAQFQWLGGFATLITFILVLAPWEIGGLPRVGSASEAASIVASQTRLARYCGGVLRGYTILTVACFALLMLCGISAFNAMTLSFTALSTGGITPVQEELDLLLGNVGMLVLAVFLLIGATSLFWHRNLISLRVDELFKHRESYFLIVGWFILTIWFAYVIGAASGVGHLSFQTMSEGALNAASITTTSGLQSRPGIFALMPVGLILILAVIGGCGFSTSGGVRCFRVGIMLTQAEHELNRLIYPSSVQATRYRSSVLNLDFLKGVWGLFAIWITLLALLGVILSLTGMGFQTAFTAAIAALSNAGPLYGSFWDPSNSTEWPEYYEMSGLQLIILSIAMFLGRLEIIAVFASLALLFNRYR